MSCRYVVSLFAQTDLSEDTKTRLLAELGRLQGVAYEESRFLMMILTHPRCLGLILEPDVSSEEATELRSRFTFPGVALTITMVSDTRASRPSVYDRLADS